MDWLIFKACWQIHRQLKFSNHSITKDLVTLQNILINILSKAKSYILLKYVFVEKTTGTHPK